MFPGCRDLFERIQTTVVQQCEGGKKKPGELANEGASASSTYVAVDK